MSIPNTPSQINMREGLRSRLPTRASTGEPLFATDTGELFVGQGANLPPIKVGMSDYEKWLYAGNTGTLEQFYSSTIRQNWQQSDW